MTARPFRLRVALAIAAVSAAALGPETTAVACCPAWRLGEPVRIADQRILVAWDPVTGIEHFVREARFAGQSGATNFGFLVPTPSEPDLAEADGAIFDALAETSKPRVVDVPRTRMHWTLVGSLLLRRPEPASRVIDESFVAKAAVQVVKTARVAGYDAAVLRADDPELLGTWLADNGYESRPALVEWARPYVERGWMITAFKYAGGAERIDVSAVRMSFATPEPIFPYRVPTDQIAPEGRGHLLRAYVVGPGRASGTLGEGDAARPWTPSRVTYSRPLAADGGSSQSLTRALPAGATAPLADAWLTAFEDGTWPSGTDDLAFGFDANAEPFQQVVERRIDRDVLVPLDLLGLASCGLLLGRRRGGDSSP